MIKKILLAVPSLTVVLIAFACIMLPPDYNPHRAGDLLRGSGQPEQTVTW